MEKLTYLEIVADFQSKLPGLLQHYKANGVEEADAKARLEKLKVMDPTGTYAMYVPWLAILDSRGETLPSEDVVKATLAKLEQLKGRGIAKGPKFDVTAYSSFASLKQAVDGTELTPSRREEKEERKQEIKRHEGDKQKETLEKAKTEYKVPKGARVLINTPSNTVIECTTGDATRKVFQGAGFNSVCISRAGGYAESYLKYGKIYMWLKEGKPFAAISEQEIQTAENRQALLTRAERQFLESIGVENSWKTQNAAEARNPDTPTDRLAELAQSNAEDTRCQVANNRGTPLAVLQQLAKDPNQRVRLSVAQNPNASVAVLEILGKDQEGEVRHYVASNPSTPLKLMTQLATDKDAYVRQCVADNPKVTKELLIQLSKDSDQRVSERATRAFNDPAFLKKSSRQDVVDLVNQGLKFSSEAMFFFATKILKKALPEAEPIIKSSPWYWFQYQKAIGK